MKKKIRIVVEGYDPPMVRVFLGDEDISYLVSALSQIPATDASAPEAIQLTLMPEHVAITVKAKAHLPDATHPPLDMVFDDRYQITKTVAPFHGESAKAWMIRLFDADKAEMVRE